MADESRNGTERAIGRLEGKMDGALSKIEDLHSDHLKLSDKIDDHIATESGQFDGVLKKFDGVSEKMDRIRQDVTTIKTQRNMIVAGVGIAAGVASALLVKFL